jgi:hypothetical protein
MIEDAVAQQRPILHQPLHDGPPERLFAGARISGSGSE